MLKKNIMFIVPNMIGGGAQKAVANLTFYLKDYYNIHIVTFVESNSTYEFVAEHHFIPKDTKNNSFLGRKIAYFNQIRRIKKLKKSLSIFCSISFLPEADILNVLSKSNEKIIISIRATLTKREHLPGNTSKLFNYSLKKADKIVSITDGVKSHMVKSFGVPSDKIITIYNPMDIHIQDSQYSYAGDVISTMGRLEPVKGQWHLIRVFAEIVKQKPKAKLYILGKGSLEGYLRKLVNEYGLNNNVVFTGFVLNPFDYIKKSSVFVFPSLNEGLGNALLEVMQLGVPIISFDCKYGPREIIAPGTFYEDTNLSDADFSSPYGILVPVCDRNFYSAKDKLTNEEIILRDTILKILDDKDLLNKYSEGELIRVRDFSLESIGEQWKKLIESI